MYCLDWYCHKEGIIKVFKRDRSYLQWMLLSDKIRFCWRQQCPSTARSLRRRRCSLRDRPSRFCRPRWHTWSAAFWFRNYKKSLALEFSGDFLVPDGDEFSGSPEKTIHNDWSDWFFHLFERGLVVPRLNVEDDVRFGDNFSFLVFFCGFSFVVCGDALGLKYSKLN